MREDKGITLVAVIITVIVLIMLSGVIILGIGNTYENSTIIQFTSYMKMIQKEVDYYVEEGTDATTLGRALNTTNKERLQNIIRQDTRNLIDTDDVNSEQIRYFNSADIYRYFNIADIADEIVVNFENREVISLNGIEKKRKYVLRRKWPIIFK